MNTFFKLSAIIVMLSVFSACHEQSTEASIQNDVWKWGFNEIEEKEKVVLMEDMLRVSNYKQAQVWFDWIIKENPQIHPSIYDNGLAIYQGLIEEAEDQKTKLTLEAQKDKISKLKKKYFPGEGN